MVSGWTPRIWKSEKPGVDARRPSIDGCAAAMYASRAAHVSAGSSVVGSEAGVLAVGGVTGSSTGDASQPARTNTSASVTIVILSLLTRPSASPSAKLRPTRRRSHRLGHAAVARPRRSTGLPVSVEAQPVQEGPRLGL